MYNVSISIEVRKQDQYGSNAYAKSERTTLATGDDILGTIDEVAEQLVADIVNQTNTRRAAENASS